jgi:hypothetical protein
MNSASFNANPLPEKPTGDPAETDAFIASFLHEVETDEYNDLQKLTPAELLQIASATLNKAYLDGIKIFAVSPELLTEETPSATE